VAVASSRRYTWRLEATATKDSTHYISKMWPVSPKTIPDTMLALSHQSDAGAAAGFAPISLSYSGKIRW